MPFIANILKEFTGPDTTAEYWERARSPLNSTRIHLLKTFYVPDEILEHLSHDENKYVRKGVASHINTAPELLAELSKDLSAFIRRGVARNSNTPQHILDSLSNDGDKPVLVLVAANTHTPLKTLWRFLERRTEYLKKTEASSFGVESIFNFKLTSESIAANPSATVPMLELLYEDRDKFHIRHRLAGNPNCTPELLGNLLCDPLQIVRKKALDHPGVTVPMLIRLFEHERSFRVIEFYDQYSAVFKLYRHPLLPQAVKSVIESLWPEHNFKPLAHKKTSEKVLR